MLIGELEKGDIIVLRRLYYPEGCHVVDGKVYDSKNNLVDSSKCVSTYDDHVAMYSGKDSLGRAILLHSNDTVDPDFGTSGLSLSLLRPKFAQEEDEAVFDVQYLVYRCKDSQLAATAHSLLLGQSRLKIPYDHDKLSEMLDEEDDLRKDDKPLSDYLHISRKSYLESGRDNAIQYAKSQKWGKTQDDGSIKGMICYTSVILAYQIAELYSLNLVTPVSDVIWGSSRSDSLMKPKATPVKFFSFVSSPTKMGALDGMSTASRTNELNENKVKEFISVLPLDAEKCTVSAMTAYFSEQVYLPNKNAVHWLSLGTIEGLKPNLIRNIYDKVNDASSERASQRSPSLASDRSPIFGSDRSPIESFPPPPPPPGASTKDDEALAVFNELVHTLDGMPPEERHQKLLEILRGLNMENDEEPGHQSPYMLC